MRLIDIPLIDIYPPKNLRKNLINFFELYWEYIITFILLVLFYSFEENKLLIGSAILIFLGVKRYIVVGIKDKKLQTFFLGVLILYTGLIALFANFILTLGADAFIFLAMTVFLCVVIIFTLFLNRFDRFAKVLGFLIFIFVSFFSTITFGSLFVPINIEGFSSGFFYISVIFLMLFTILTYFVIISMLLNKIQNYLEIDYVGNYFYFFLAVCFLSLSGGYYYLNFISESNYYLKDFFLILSIAFVSSAVGVSSIKTFIKSRC
jgi:hypothetical protein